MNSENSCFCQILTILFLEITDRPNVVGFLSGVFQSVRYKVHETEDIFVDGGLLCNYPIHAFDGKLLLNNFNLTTIIEWT